MISSTTVSAPQVDLRPHTDNIRSDGYLTLKKAARLLSFQPHMHNRGKAECLEAIYPTGRVETLSCAKFRFNWHLNYVYSDDAAPLLPAGTVLHSIMWHDNTAANPFNPDPDAQITYGQRTIDEMASAWISWYYMSDEDFKKETEARRARRTTLHEHTLRKEVGMKKCMLAVASSALLLAGTAASERRCADWLTPEDRMSARRLTDGNRIPTAPTRCISATSTETPRRSSTCRSVRTTTSIRAATAASRHTSIRRGNGGCSRSSCPRIGRKTGELVWTLTTHGKTNQAKGWLQPEWEVDKDLIAKNAARDPSLMTIGDERDGPRPRESCRLR